MACEKSGALCQRQFPPTCGVSEASCLRWDWPAWCSGGAATRVGVALKKRQRAACSQRCSQESASNLGLDLKRFHDLTAPGIKITLEKP